MGLSRTVSEINGDFSQKSENFPNPVYFVPPLKAFPLKLGSKTRMIILRGLRSSLTIFSAVWVKRTNVTDGRTDRYRAIAKTALTHSVARY